MDHAHHHSGHARPSVTSPCGEDRPTVRANPPKTRGSRVSLADSVRGNQPETSVLSQQIERPTIEVRDQIRIAVGFLMDGFEPVKIPVAVAVNQRVFASERRIPHHRIKPAVLTSEHFWELDLPVKRLDGQVSGVEFVHGIFQW